jgi:hypothetical protein
VFQSQRQHFVSKQQKQNPMKVFKKSRSKKISSQQTFVFDIHELSPWPPLHGPLIIEWQRGSKRRGHSNPCQPESDEANTPTSYDFGKTRFEIPATLYAKSSKDGAGEAESKTVSLFVCQVTDKGKVGNMVGAVTLDLARLSVLTNIPARQEYIVECSQSISEMSGGRPKLIMSLSVAGDDGDVQKELAQKSTVGDVQDPIPSTLSTEVPSSQGEVTELSSMKTVVSPRSKLPGQVANIPAMPKVEEFDADGFLIDDEDASPDDGRLPFHDDEQEDTYSILTDTLSSYPGSETRKNLTKELEHAKDSDSDTNHMEKEHVFETDLTPFRASKQKPIHTRRFSRDVNSFGSIHQFKGDESGQSKHGIPSMVGSCNSAMPGNARQSNINNISPSTQEFQVLAALEMSVWSAGYGWGSIGCDEIPRREDMQAPARRLARTIISLGQERGLGFVERAIDAIKRSCIASLKDIQTTILWWSTVVTLRWSFWTLQNETGARPSSTFEWLQVDACMKFKSIESWLYDRILTTLWDSQVMPGIIQARSISSNVDDLTSMYIHILDGCIDRFEDTTRPTPCSKTLKSVLKRLLLHGISVKLDVTLLQELLGQHVKALSPLTSTQGLELKILVDNISKWFEKNGLDSSQVPDWYAQRQNNASTHPEVDKDWCLPRMVSAANVIVTPKPALLDTDVRSNIAPSISLTSICQILRQYTSIEGEEQEDIDGTLNTLRSKTSGKIDLNESFESMDSIEYHPPPEHWISQQGLIQPLSLELSPDSDDELTTMETSSGGERFKTLRDLWFS